MYRKNGICASTKYLCVNFLYTIMFGPNMNIKSELVREMVSFKEKIVHSFETTKTPLQTHTYKS